jgi:hypothetical protein
MVSGRLEKRGCTVCSHLESVLWGKGDLAGMLSVGEVKPRRGCSRSLPIPRREGHGNTSGSGRKAKDAEGPVNQYAGTVNFDKTLKGRATPREG